MTNTFVSATTYEKLHTDLLVNDFLRSESRAWRVLSTTGCPDSAYCVSVIPGARQTSWGRTRFRNGLVLTPLDSIVGGGAGYGYILDERWALQPTFFQQDDPNNQWWDVLEHGVLIGHARQQGRNWGVGQSDNTFLNSLATMTIFDLAGKEVPPDLSRIGQRLAFPEDSLGFFLDSMRIDSAGRSLRLRLSWRFDPLLGLPDKDSATLSIDISNLKCLEVESSCGTRLSLDNPIRSATGTYETAIPLDSLRIALSQQVTVTVVSRRDSLVGTRAQTRRDFYAYVDTTYAGAEIAP
jgi:hypothetical protein